MLGDILYFIFGLALIIGGANILTDGASAVARRFKVSDLVIGLTIVAIGSSTPDLVVAITSTLEHKSQLAVGDVVGANLFDILIVVGIVALMRPLRPSRTMLNQDFPMLLISSAALFFCADDTIIDGSPANLMDRTDGLMLLCLFSIFMWNTFLAAKSPVNPAPPISPVPHVNPVPSSPPVPPVNPVKNNPTRYLQSLMSRYLWFAALCVVAGLAALVIGGNWLVDGASGIARLLGMSEALIGLTIVAFCGAAPDLATAVTATLKGKQGIAMGSVIGGCIINVFLVLGLSATIMPLDASGFDFVDFGTLLLGSVLLLLFSRILTPGRITRWQGILLILLYVAYMLHTILPALHS